jgi:transposase-like protein
MECRNFGRPASTVRQKRGAGNKATDDYIVENKGNKRVRLICKVCRQSSIVKSNQGIFEESARLSSYLDIEPTITGCPSTTCKNQIVDVLKGLPFYKKETKTAGGSHRYRCKECGKTFSVSVRPNVRQRVPYKNKTILKLLMNKEPFRRICEVAEISMPTLYKKIDFFHAQFQAFIADRERKLLTMTSVERLYLATDRQEYVVNWSNTFDKRNVVLKGLGTADLRSGYVFGMHVNYDSRLEPRAIEELVRLNGDAQLDMPLREFARVWIEVDHEAMTRRKPRKASDPIPEGALGLDIEERYKEVLKRGEIEASDDPEEHIRLPVQGMQIHEEYTMYGHFLFLKKLLGNVGKLRFFMDQDSGLRAACLSTFTDEILAGRCDAFYVRVNKDLTVHQKRRLVGMYNRDMDVQRNKYPMLTDKSIRLLWITEEMKRLKPIGKWDDRWLEYPFPDMSEPEKAVCYLTDRNDMEEMQLAHLYHMASLHKIDSFFNQIRARLNPLDRPMKSSSNRGGSYLRYQVYKPELVQKLLDIFRVYHNFHLKGHDDKLTPAMRLVLARAPIPIDDIINFRH